MAASYGSDFITTPIDEEKKLQDVHIEGPGHGTARRRLEPSPFIRSLSPDERAKLELSLRRKIDTRLLPMVILMYIMNYLDRNNIAAARLAGLEEELELSSTQYQASVSILFVGYILMQVPSNLVLNKIGKPAIYLPICMIIWGVISAATSACKGFGGLIACRFFLGFVEAAYFPGCLYYLSCWYTRKELSLRTAVLYSGSLISGAFGGLIAAGITGNMDGSKGLRAWKWLFIIEGAITVFIAFAAFLVLPNFPRTTPWLTEKERELAIWRLQEDIGQDDWVNSEEQTFWHGFKLAFSDIKVYVLMLILFGFVTAGSVTNFFPTVVKTLGYDNIETLLLTAPPYVLACITCLANTWHADRTGERYLHICLPMAFGIFAFILGSATTSTAPRYVAMMFMPAGVYTGYVVALAWISNTIPRPPAKRAAALAAINAVSNAAQIWTSFLYPVGAGPRYVKAMSVNGGLLLQSAISATILRMILVRLNKKLERGEHVEGAISTGEAVPGEAAEKGFRFLV